MCIAILNTKGVLSLKTFKTCWQNNPDGAGLCYFDGEKIQIHKEMKSVKSFHKVYLSVREQFPEIDIAIHFRVSTHGRVNVTNCHPFKVNKFTGFIHNGVISNVETSPDLSDTYIFNETIMKALPSNFVKNNAMLDLLSVYIGYSKLVIISGENSAIVNEELGHWSSGNWYSNKTYISESKPITSQSKSIFAPKVDTYTKNVWNDWDIWDFDEKSGIYVNKKPDLCECCRETKDSIRFINQWGMNVCDDCCNQFHADIYEK